MTAHTARDRLNWLLGLIPRIADEKWHEIEKLERENGPWVQALLADLREIGDRSNAPGGFVEGLQVFFSGDAISVRSNHFLRPVLLTPEEAAALELGLALLEGERPPDERPALERLRAKVRESLTSKPTANIHGTKSKTTDMHADAAAAGDPALVALLRRAMRARQVAEIQYQKSGSAVPGVRRVHPYALVAHRGKWMLSAYCEATRERRIFRVDRIRVATPTSDVFERPADAGDVRTPELADATDVPSVVIRYSPRIAKWIGERVVAPPGAHVLVDGESITIEHPLRDEGWAVRHVLQYGPEAEVISPPSVREAVKQTLASMIGGNAKGARKAPRAKAKSSRAKK